MSIQLCGARNPGNRAFTCGKQPGHLAVDPLHKLDPGDPASMEWLDEATAGPTAESDATAVSLFAGVGGLDRAAEVAGFKVVAAVEIDYAARGVINDRMPKTTLFDDVTKVTANELLAAGFDPRRGVVTAGFPCQDLSVAGRRKGMATGTRSGLYWHVVRLLADLRPRWVVLENVPGLLSAGCPCLGDGRCGSDTCDGELHSVTGGACGPGRCMVEHGGAMGAVLGSLGDLGYGFAYRVLDAQHFGVPQRRRRVVIVGCLGDDRRPVEVLLEPQGGCRNSAPSREAGARVAATLTAGTSRPGVSAPGRRQEDDENIVVAPTLTAGYAEQSGQDYDNGQLVVSVAENQRGEVVTSSVTQALSKGGGKPGQGFPLIAVQPVALRGRDHGAELEVGAVGAPSNALRTPGGGSSHAMVAVSVAGDRTHALTAEGHDASEDGTGRGTPVVAFAWQAGGNNDASGAFMEDCSPTLPKSQTMAVQTPTTVRRLTPRECERLQGFPDDWTATSWGKPQADSARYKQMGNAVAVVVFAWVMSRMSDHATSPAQPAGGDPA